MQGPFRVGVEQRRLVFTVANERHEIDASLVLEVIRVPFITRVPHGPEALAGIANVRGKAVPVLSMSQILTGDKTPGQGGKIILYERHGAIGLLVDDVLDLSTESTASSPQGFDERLDVVFSVVSRAPVRRIKNQASEVIEGSAENLTALLSFRVAGQLYGLPLGHIREVLKKPSDVTVFPNSAEAVVGLIPMRGGFLSLVSLASILGLNRGVAEAQGPIIVVEHRGDLVGLVVDELDAIRRLPEGSIDSVPAVLQRGRGEAQIEAIGRVADVDLLISILSPDKLYSHRAVEQALDQTLGETAMETSAEESGVDVEQFLIFQLGQESYGLPIVAVDEVVRVPAEITRVPGAPGYVMGVMNLRGKAIPLIDQRTRFDTPRTTQTKSARAIILTLGDLKSGFVVDGVSEVKAISATALSQAPEFSSGQTGVFDRIAHVEADDRMILLVDPKELLSRAERDIVAAITGENNVVADT